MVVEFEKILDCYYITKTLGLVLLCVPCGALYRPIEFIPIYNEEDEAFLQMEEMEILEQEDLNLDKLALQNGTAVIHGNFFFYY